ncbi:GntR family transcriptional regulator [Kocuria gwangalliensis]|uniref:GntR family transcriptional regulator n=1 Tax=Kocuria gwangalliensis TaxID=501592 RepID=A0ABP8X881_9MICC
MSTNAAERAYAHAKARILSGELEGQLLSEGIVAEELGVSRTPVREAFLRLQAEGLMRLYPKRGALVVPVGPFEAREVLEARRVIECGCIAAALSDPTLPATLNELLEQQSHAVGTERFTLLDAAFHTAIVEAAGNSLLSTAYSGLRDRQMRLIAMAVGTMDGKASEILNQHRDIVRAVESGEAEHVRALLWDRLRHVYEGIVE